MIPDGWETRHAPVADATHTATVTIHAPTTSGDLWRWDETLGRSVPAVGAVAVADVSARVQRLREEAVTIAGGQPVTIHRYLIALHRDTAGAAVGGTLHVDASSDPALTGETLHIVDVMLGSLRVERHILAIHHLTPVGEGQP